MRPFLPAVYSWRLGKIDELHGQLALARLPIRRRIKAQKVEVSVAGKRTGIAWGQFLDPDHHSGTHWGRFGTTAALQALALDLHWHGNQRHLKKVRQVHPLMYLAPDVLLHDRPGHQLPEELKQGDLEDPMKVAFLVDALEPDACEEIVQDDPPWIVGHLLSLALDDGDGWSTRPPGDPDRTDKDRLLITAYALWVLRRFPQAQTDERISGAFGWLADELNEGRKTLGEDILALGALALASATDVAKAHPYVAPAIAGSIAELEAWARRLPRPVVGRPYFNCYSRGEGNDYIFLSPELLCALLFLHERPSRRARLFILRVVKALADNVVPPGMPPELREQPHGFSIQRGMEGTVDQMWVMRLAHRFHRSYVEDRKGLRPSRVGWPGAIAVIIALACIGIVIADPGIDAVNVLLAAVLSAALGIALLELRERRRQRGD